MEISFDALTNFLENLPGHWLSSCGELAVVWGEGTALRMYVLDGLREVDIRYPGCEKTAWHMEKEARQWLFEVRIEGMTEELETLADRGEWGELVETLNAVADEEGADPADVCGVIEEVLFSQPFPEMRPLPAGGMGGGVQILAARIDAVDDWRLICYSAERGVWHESADQDSIESSEIWRFAPLLVQILEADKNASEDDKAAVAATLALYQSAFEQQKADLSAALY